MTVESLSALGVNVHYRQTISPNHQYGSFTADDTDNHDFIFQGRGKSVISIAIDNPANKDLSWTLYGMHESDGEVGDAGTFTIDSGTVSSGNKDDEGFVGYTYPYYLLRLAYSVKPTDNPAETVSLYIDANIGF